MKTLSKDTPPGIERIQMEAYRKMNFAEKWQLIADLNRTAELLALADVRQRYPNASEYECRLRVASRRISADLMKKAYGWDPEKEGY